jgi:hypothetical protein
MRKSVSARIAFSWMVGAYCPTNPTHQPTNPALDMSVSRTPMPQKRREGLVSALLARTKAQPREYLL